MHVSMPTCLDLCSHTPTCLDLCSLHTLCHLSCACVFHAMFVCLGLSYVCYAMCYCSTFVAFVTLPFVLAYWFEYDLDPMVLVLIHMPWPISKGLDHPICMSMFARFYALSSMLASLVLGFATLDALSGFVVVWLHTTPLRPSLGVFNWDASLDE